MNSIVTLKVNGQPVRLNPFVQKILVGTLGGLVGSLDDLPAEVEKIEVTVSQTAEEDKR